MRTRFSEKINNHKREVEKMVNMNSELAHTNHILRLENDIMVEQAKMLISCMDEIKERKNMENKCE